MNYIRITKENIDREHICCAMSGKQSLAKKEWLKQRLDEGLVFYRSEERGKCFIEYIPAESAWVPIEADGYIYINCLWIAGSMKGHGYSNDLLNECINDAVALKKASASYLPKDARGNFFPIRNIWSTRAFPSQMCPIAGLTLCICPLCRTPSRQNSENAPSIRR